MRPAAIAITIDRLVLEGFDRGERHGIAEAIEQHLAEKFASESMAGIRSAEHVNAGAISVAPRAKAQDVGAAAAGAIHEGLAR